MKLEELLFSNFANACVTIFCYRSPDKTLDHMPTSAVLFQRKRVLAKMTDIARASRLIIVPKKESSEEHEQKG